MTVNKAIIPPTIIVVLISLHSLGSNEFMSWSMEGWHFEARQKNYVLSLLYKSRQTTARNTIQFHIKSVYLPCESIILCTGYFISSHVVFFSAHPRRQQWRSHQQKCKPTKPTKRPGAQLLHTKWRRAKHQIRRSSVSTI